MIPDTVSPLTFHMLSGEYDLDLTGFIRTEKSLADKSNLVTSLAGIGFSLSDQSRLQELYTLCCDAVGAYGKKLDNELLEVLDANILDYLLHVVARQEWRLEQMEPELYGPKAVWYQGEENDGLDGD